MHDPNGIYIHRDEATAYGIIAFFIVIVIFCLGFAWKKISQSNEEYRAFDKKVDAYYAHFPTQVC